MNPRFIIRHPHILSTPRVVAQGLGIRTRVPRFGREVRWDTNFFMGYPNPEWVRGDIREYSELWHFFKGTKWHQRQDMARHGLPVPRDATLPRMDAGVALPWKAIVRPHRHQGGADYHITERYDFNPATHYATYIFPKTHEYRIIYVFGEPIIFLRKKPHEGVTHEQAWNHGNSTFSTIPHGDWGRSNLSVHTRCLEQLREFPVIRNADYVGADILYNRETHEYVICELNSCPAIQIEENLGAVVRAIREG